jgi:hypothetical protein
MNESSLTEVHLRRLLTQVNPCIRTNVTTKISTRSVVVLMSLPPIPAFCQRAAPATTSRPEPKRVFRIVPDFRASPSLAEYKPLNSREKFGIATLDSFDRGTVAPKVLFAAEAKLTNSNPSFCLTGDVFPTILNQDRRYFRRSKGSGWSRPGYAAGQIFWTHNDSDRGQFNVSEIAGNSTTVAISMADYPGNRDAADGLSRLGSHPGVDMPSNILKEFRPDLDRKFSPKHKSTGNGAF